MDEVVVEMLPQLRRIQLEGGVVDDAEKVQLQRGKKGGQKQWRERREGRMDGVEWS